MKTFKEEALENLKEYAKPGDTVYTILRHVSRSGMLRYIDLVVFREERPIYLTYWTKEVLGWGGSSKHEGVKVQGCGMDMGFHLVYSLSSALYRQTGYECLGDKCPSPHHVNSNTRNTIEDIHHDGYALRQRWL